MQDQTQFSAYYWNLIIWEITKIQCEKERKTDTQCFFRPLLFTDSFSINFNSDANLIFAFWGSVNWNLQDLKHNIMAHFILSSYYRVDHININSTYQGLGNVLQKHFTWHFKESLDGGRSWFLLLKLPLQNIKRKREEKWEKTKQKKNLNEWSKLITVLKWKIKENSLPNIR